jgi:uncharacterized protein YndB with AHSA1/START domain
VKTTIEVTVEVEIAAPRAAVWAFVTDAERLPEWLEEFESAHQVSEGPPGVGTIVRYTIKQGHRSGTVETVEWEPESRMSWDGPPLAWAGGGARPRGSYELTDAGEGRTLLTAHFRPELSGTQVLLSPYLKRWVRRQRHADAQKLKALLEGNRGS